MSDATPSTPTVRIVIGAAIAIGVLAFLSWGIGDGVRMAPWQREALAFVRGVAAGQMKLDRESPQPAELVAWLQEQQAPVLPTLPDALASACAIGGRTWQWRGLKFAALSFRLEGTATAHLVSTWLGGLKGAPPPGQMNYLRADGWNVATWSEGGLACLLATDAGEEDLLRLLASRGQGAPSLRVAVLGRECFPLAR
jgi:hypothetical protein